MESPASLSEVKKAKAKIGTNGEASCFEMMVKQVAQ